MFKGKAIASPLNKLELLYQQKNSYRSKCDFNLLSGKCNFFNALRF